VAAMKLSVIVPAYNMAAYVHECLLSLLAQKTNFEFEVIVCNDTSPDRTLEICLNLAQSWPNLKVLNNEQNLGLVGTMRRLLTEAKGDYIAYLDADDVALPGKLQKQVDYLEQNPDCALVYHESDMFDSTTGAQIKLYSKDFYNAAYIPQKADITHLIRYGTFLQASSIMFRRHEHLLEALEHGCKIICDYPWHIMNLGYLKGTADLLPEVLGKYRVHSASFCAQTQKSYERRLTVLDELISACRLGHKFDIECGVIDAGIAHQYYAAALFFLKSNNVELFEKMIMLSIEKNIFFDSRHQKAFEFRLDPDYLKTILF